MVRARAITRCPHRKKLICFSRLGDAEPDRETWKRAYQLYVQAFREPTTEAEKKKLSRLLKKPLPKEVADDIFTYDAFLWGLGRMSLSITFLTHVNQTRH